MLKRDLVDWSSYVGVDLECLQIVFYAGGGSSMQRRDFLVVRVLKLAESGGEGCPMLLVSAAYELDLGL
jgi:hypothetical protein